MRQPQFMKYYRLDVERYAIRLPQITPPVPKQPPTAAVGFHWEMFSPKNTATSIIRVIAPISAIKTVTIKSVTLLFSFIIDSSYSDISFASIPTIVEIESCLSDVISHNPLNSPFTLRLFHQTVG